jgi:predicted MPP superfamily phosphohydrolase
MQYLSWLVFLHLPIYVAFFALRLDKRHRVVRVVLWCTTGLIAAIGFDAFLVEPQALEVTHRRLIIPKVDRPLRIAVLADIQTDRPGAYEQRVLACVKQENPDLILFAGDYIQIADRQAYLEAVAKLNQLIQQADLHPPLGSIAVQGNIDYTRPWKKVFADTDTTVVGEETTLDLGPVVVTTLSMAQSYDTRTAVTTQDKYHIVLGHVPNYALGDIHADLLIAGHTHGGQVRLPFIGPLLTFSQVPRAWAAGQTEIAPGKTLLVSRGIGHECAYAPRLRFLCRPELAIMDILPEQANVTKER